MAAPASSLPPGPIALIGGSSFLESSYLSSFTPRTVSTPHGSCIVHANASQSLYFVQRHHANPDYAYSPPHLINKRSIMTALLELGVSTVIAFGSVGSLKPAIPVGQLVIPDDFYDADPVTLFDYEPKGHMSAAHCTPTHTHTRAVQRSAGGG